MLGVPRVGVAKIERIDTHALRRKLFKKAKKILAVTHKLVKLVREFKPLACALALVYRLLHKKRAVYLAASDKIRHKKRLFVEFRQRNPWRQHAAALVLQRRA